MNKAAYLRNPADLHLHQVLVRHLQQNPDKYIHLWEYYGSQGALFNLLQRMLDVGEIVADHLQDGLITDQSLITLVETLKTGISPVQPSLHQPLLHRPFA